METEKKKEKRQLIKQGDLPNSVCHTKSTHVSTYIIKIKGHRVKGEQCMGNCICAKSFLMTVVPLGKLQHKVSYMYVVDSGECKECVTVDPFTQILQVLDTWHLPRYPLRSLLYVVVSQRQSSCAKTVAGSPLTPVTFN